LSIVRQTLSEQKRQTRHMQLRVERFVE